MAVVRIVVFALVAILSLIYALISDDKDSSERKAGAISGVVFILSVIGFFASLHLRSMELNPQRYQVIEDLKGVTVDTTYIISNNITDTIYTIHYTDRL